MHIDKYWIMQCFICIDKYGNVVAFNEPIKINRKEQFILKWRV